MRVLITAFAFLAFCVVSLHSQPQVSYIIPDIGAPGMNIYVEIIAPFNQKGTYGNDGFYLNNPGDNLRVQPLNPNDTNKITIGPLIVSWDGRMISTQIFVNHTLTPNAFDALSLNSNFVIPLVVVRNNSASSPFNYYIVRPRPYFDGQSNQLDTVFGQGALGTRSPRGAMIFDSLRLGPKTYRVSVADCDPNTVGNQGYLPFILLSKGPIIGTTGTQITVNAGEEGNNLVQQAGPGGGGGGGSFCDFTGVGFRGGDGFTGGGPGGRNRAGNPVLSDFYTLGGNGTGPDIIIDNKLGGYSLNGIMGGSSPAYEAAAGGTGHPFGLSGIGCNDGNNCEPDGRYGAGSGFKQNSPGGAGGYATVGIGGRGNSNGFAHGNDMIVPIAGGSGGAGGNPQCAFDCSAAGGGGGGAIRIFAQSIQSVFISANGKGGAINGCGDSQGGSGSGGHVGVNSKLNSTNVQVTVAGGTNTRGAITTTGGAGRVRFDALSVTSINSSPANASTFRGIVTDTSKWVKREHTLRGFQNSESRQGKTKLYMKSESTLWEEIGEIADGFTGVWNFNIDLPEPDKYFYLVAVQEIKLVQAGEHNAIPSHIMSQAAANMFLLDLKPEGRCPTRLDNTDIHCLGDTIMFAFYIRNLHIANADLHFTLNNDAWVNGRNGFEIVSQLGEIIVPPGDSSLVVVRYVYPGGDKKNIVNRLRIPNNDPVQDPFFVNFSVTDILEPEISVIGNAPLDFTFPDTKVGQSSDLEIRFRNTGESYITIDELPQIGTPFSVVSMYPSPVASIPPDGEFTITVRFSPTSNGDYNSILNVQSIRFANSCPASNNTELYGKAVEALLSIDKFLVDFGVMAYCETKTDTIKIQNTGTTDITFFTPNITGADASLFSIANQVEYPIKLNANENPPAGFTIIVRFTADRSSPGTKNARLLLTTDDPENSPIEITLTAEVVGFNVTSNPSVINFGDVYVGFDTQQQVTLTNNAAFTEYISALELVQITNMTATTPNPLIMPQSANSTFTLSLNKQSSGVADGIVLVYFDRPCDDTLRIPVRANGLLSFPTMLFDNEIVLSYPDTNTRNKVDILEFGVYPNCIVDPFRHLKLFEYLNNSQAPYIILSEILDANFSGRFSIVQTAVVPPDTINPGFRKGGAQIFFDSDGAADGIYTADLNVEIYRNGKTEWISFTIRAHVISGSITTNPITLQLNAFVGETDTGNWSLVNDGPWEIQIMTVNFTGDASIWSYSPDPTNFVLDALSNNRLDMTFTFTPPDENDYFATLQLLLSVGGCERTVVLNLTGKGSPSFSMTLRMPTLTASPTDDNLKMPIYATVDMANPTQDQFVFENLELIFNRSMYYPVSINNGEILSQNYNGNNRIVNLRIPVNMADIQKVGQEFVLTELTGYAMLGNEEWTPLTLGTVQHNYGSRVKAITKFNGILNIEICDEGGSRLLTRTAPFSAVMTPNPASEILRLTINTAEQGLHTIKITDINGNTVYKDKISARSGETYELTILTDFLPTGLYFTEISSPTESITIPTMLIK